MMQASSHLIRRQLWTVVCFTLLIMILIGHQQAQATADSFPDVSDAHWANVHISKLSLHEVIQGFEDGTYQPSRPVLQQEVLVLAIRMLGLEEEALALNSGIILPLEMSNYAKPYIIKALDEGLLDLQEERNMTLDAVNWGQREATREWVAQMVVRMAGQASFTSVESPSFIDQSQISAWAFESVEQAAAMQIITGFEDGSFRPLNSVTRAEMAAMLSRVEAYIPVWGERYAKGLLIDLTNTTITIRQVGENLTIPLSEEALLFRTDLKGGKSLQWEGLPRYSSVYVSIRNGTAVLLDVLKPPAAVEFVQGIIDAIDLTDMRIELTMNGQTAWFSMDNEAFVQHVDGRSLSLSELVVNSTAEAAIEPNSFKIVSISIIKVPFNFDGEVSLISLDLNDRTMRVQHESELEILEVAESVQMSYGESIVPRLDYFEVNDRLRIHVVNHMIVEIELLERIVEVVGDQSVIGQFYRYDDTDQFIMVQQENQVSFTGFFVADDATVILPGLLNSSFRHLLAGDQLELSIEDGLVESIKILNREVQPEILITVVQYDAISGFLTVQDELGEPAVFRIDSNTEAYLDDQLLPTALLEAYLSSGNPARIAAAGKRVLRLTFPTITDGELLVIDTVQRKLTLKLADGSEKSYQISHSVVTEWPRMLESDWKNLTPGQKLRVKTNLQQTIIQRILVNTQDAAKFMALNDLETIWILDNYLLMREYSLGESFTYTQTDGHIGPLWPEVNEVVSLHLLGNTLVSAQAALVESGRFENVQSSTRILTIMNAQNELQTYSLSQSVEIRRNGQVVSWFSVVRTDRLVIMRLPNGEDIIFVTPLTFPGGNS